MNIERLSKLLNSFGSSSQTTQAQNPVKTQATSDEAVKLTSGFGKAGSSQEDTSERGQRVAAIKEQVRSGSYKPESNQVASAVARELFA